MPEAVRRVMFVCMWLDRSASSSTSSLKPPDEEVLCELKLSCEPRLFPPSFNRSSADDADALLCIPALGSASAFGGEVSPLSIELSAAMLSALRRSPVRGRGFKPVPASEV